VMVKVNLTQCQCERYESDANRSVTNKHHAKVKAPEP
jgi:hypothetical protein